LVAARAQWFENQSGLVQEVDYVLDEHGYARVIEGPLPLAVDTDGDQIPDGLDPCPTVPQEAGQPCVEPSSLAIMASNELRIDDRAWVTSGEAFGAVAGGGPAEVNLGVDAQVLQRRVPTDPIQPVSEIHPRGCGERTKQRREGGIVIHAVAA
jgi:hypothetical protein